MQTSLMIIMIICRSILLRRNISDKTKCQNTL